MWCWGILVMTQSTICLFSLDFFPAHLLMNLDKGVDVPASSILSSPTGSFLSSLSRFVSPNYGGKGQFVCERCHTTFTQKCNLHRHKLKCDRIKSYCCNICSKVYFRSDKLLAHMRSWHPRELALSSTKWRATCVFYRLEAIWYRTK